MNKYGRIFMLIAGLGVGMVPTGGHAQDKALATFAGGCFWCMEGPFEAVDGVISVTAGYTGGRRKNPSYEQVSTGATGHIEAVQVVYDPGRVTYERLLDAFWRSIDPTDDGGQFADRGSQYRTAIFYHDERQRVAAEKSRAELEASNRFGGKKIVTGIVRAEEFYPAEDYHQDYHLKNPGPYQTYRAGSGREAYLKKMWGSAEAPACPLRMPERKESRDELRARLTPMQYKVTQENGTELPFVNEFWNNHREGIYVDVVSGEPLFSSADKYDSRTGWPSFVKPLEPSNVVEKEDRSLFMRRTEVRSRNADSHLGHVFDDGPKPTGTRFCINSAALRFIPKEELEKQGYGQYRKLFK